MELIDPMCQALLLELGANFLVWLLLGAVVGLVALILGRRRVEAAVRVSEARFRTLVEASADGIAIVDGAGLITYVSPAYERMSGYSAEELIGRSYAELLHPDDLAAAASYVAALSGDPGHHALAEVRLRRKDGSWRIVESSGRLLPDGQMVGYSRDLTELRAAEAGLRAIVEGTAGATGAAFFQSLARHLAGALGVRYALVAELEAGEPPMVRTLATWAGAGPGAELRYPLAGTPCERVVGARELCFFPRGVAAAFPDDRILADWGAEGYLGYPLLDAAGQVLGHLAVLDDRPLGEEPRRADILRIFAARAGAELERQRAEGALRLAELRFRSVLAQPLLAVRIYSPDGKLLEWNETTQQLFGLSEAESVALLASYNIFADPNIERLGFAGHVRRVFAGEAVAFPPVRFGLDPARQAWSQIFMYPVMDQAGAVREVVSMSINITAQKEAEEALLRLNEQLEQRVAARTADLERALAESRRLTAILEATPDLVGISDMAGGFTYLNRAARRALGLDEAADLAGVGLTDIFTPESYERIMQEGMPAALTSGSWIGEVVNRNRRTGEEFPVSLVGIIHRAPDGRPEYMSGVSRDISERKRAEAELRAAKEAAEDALAESRRLAAILEATSDLVGTADLSGRVLYLNRAGRRLLGVGEEGGVSHLGLADLYPPDSLEQVRRNLAENLASGRTTSSFESVVRRHDGVPLPVSLVGIIHRDHAGAPQLLSAIVRDISEQKRVQAELRQARDEAEAASRAKSTFLANMSHEIRTPMNAVIGMTGLLLNTGLDGRQRDFVETIRSAGDALLAVINDILDFSKIEAGKLDLERQPFDLRACVESAVDLLAPRAEEKGLDLLYAVADDLPPAVLGDAARLRQILVNLLANAVKFTERGEVLLSVSRQGPVGDGLLFAVRDSGIGIRPDQMPHLFQSFSQLDPSTTRVFGGSGLGLAISKRLAELMGGTMWADSAGPGLGATFSFSIAAPPAALPARRGPQQHRPELAGRRALIVDDTSTNRRILSLQLRSWGLRPIEAASPRAALALLELGERFDLAILDMDLPEMDGVALAQAIRDLTEGRGLPMLMLTSLGQASAGPCAQLFAACLSKPVKPSQLYDALAALFAGEPPRAGSPLGEAPPAGAAQPLAERVPLRILLAEDVAVNQKFALLALEDLGYRADVAANGLEALEAVARQPYDVVLMDVQMPELDGLEATRRIHQLWRAGDALPAARRPYIVAMTANALQGDRELCLAAGMDDYIAKPVYLEELRAALERAGASMEPAAPEVDAATIRQLLARPRGRAILALYAEESAGLLAELEAAAAAQDAAGLRAAAHSLKGSSRYVGAARVAELSAALELRGRAGELSGAAELAAELATAHRRALALLAAAAEGGGV